MFEFFDMLFLPLRWLIEGVLVIWHAFFSLIGFNPSSGLTWVLSVLGLVIVIRASIIPVTIKSIKAQRNMIYVAPELKKIQQKYKGKKDQFSREAQARETMALYKKYGTGPMKSCLPMLLQMPFFISLFYVIRHAAENTVGIGAMNAELTKSFNEADLFGAPLKMTFQEGLHANNLLVIVLLGIIMALMVASQFFTQLQIVSKNMTDEAKQSSMYRQQKIMLYLIPVMFLFSGLVFPLALNVYWLFSNLWTMGQQALVIKHMPTPGSEAYRKRQERLKAKGKLTDDERNPKPGQEGQQKPKGQRYQPTSAKRAKKQGGKK